MGDKAAAQPARHSRGVSAVARFARSSPRSSRWLDLGTRLAFAASIAATLTAAALPAVAQDATWPGSEDYSAIANWDPDRGPIGNTLGNAATGNNPNLEFQDTNSASSATLGNSSDNDPRLLDSCSVGSAIVTNRGFLRFFGRSTTGSASFFSRSFSTTPARTAARPL